MKKIPLSKIILLILSISFVAFFLIILTLSILLTIVSGSEHELQECLNNFISFFNWLSQFDSINDPFSIFIEILSSIGGVFFGIRIGQWIDNREEEEKISELWKKINTFLKKLNEGIYNSNISIYELAEYKIYWDSLQSADNVATRYIQNDEKYVDISFAFSFLTFYSNSWNKYKSIEEWKDNVPALEASRIQSWMNCFDDLISYTDNK